MENTLIEVKTGKNGVQTVSARLLHEKLEVNHRFNEWFAALLKYGFKENEDFTRVQTCTVVNNGAKRTIIDYFITIDMAKEICMLQRSEIGKKFRQYFIKCEKALIEHTELRNKSKTVRNNFTNTLKEHGYKNPYEYIQTTKQMKDTLGITAKKSEMTDKELNLVVASENVAACAITDEYGYHEVNPVCLDASEAVANFIAERKQKRLEQKRA